MLSPAFATELSICGFYSRRPAYRQAGYDACAQLTTDRRLAPEMRRMALENFRFYAKPAKELYPSFRHRQLELFMPPGWSACNPSLFWLEGKMFGIVRSVNYKVDGGRYSSPDGVIRTQNYLVQYKDDAVVQQWPITDPEPPFLGNKIRGLEDMRPVVTPGGDVLCTATVCDYSPDMQRQMALFRLNMGEHRTELLHVHQSGRPEKNWMPLEGTDEWIYCLEPTAVVRWDGKAFAEHSVTVPPFGMEQVKGGTQAVLVGGDQWLCLTHETVFPAPPQRQYLHRWVMLHTFNNEVARVSDPFYLIHQGIEFAAGLVKTGDRLHVSFGVEDERAYLASFDLDEVMVSLLSPDGR
jgi:hypothetical protein